MKFTDTSVEPSSATASPSIRSRIKGLVFGAAVADAVGLSTEFLSKTQARHLYGNGPIRFGAPASTISGEDAEVSYPFIRDGHRSRWKDGDFTDDTDQLLALTQSVIACQGTFQHLDAAQRLKRWAEDGTVMTRRDGTVTTKPPCGIGTTVSLVLGTPGFLSDPHAAAWKVWNDHGRNFAPNGAVMRTAVVACVGFRDEKTVVENAMAAAMVTHADPRCVVSCCIVNVLVARMLAGEGAWDKSMNETELQEVRDYIVKDRTTIGSIDTTSKPDPVSEPRQRPRFVLTPEARLRLSTFLSGEDPDAKTDANSLSILYDRPPAQLIQLPPPLPLSQEKRNLVDSVVDRYVSLLPDPSSHADLLAHVRTPSLDRLNLDGPAGIGYTFKALGAAMHAFTRRLGCDMTGTKFKQAIMEIVMEAGDADTNACVAGALLGCEVGFEGLPRDWVDGLRHREELEVVVEQLLASLGEDMTA
ncbi:hypothetical protein HKX48_008764 [Thoreauomyces humboldtii]|nr:hypothetical protein HKX48_008764 [Thoreauomyces humboldtii]